MKKMIWDERVKHRLTGFLVFLSIAVIFLPAMIKRSNQQLSEHITVSVKLPPKPIAPKVAVVPQRVLFDEAKVADIKVPEPSSPPPASKVTSVAFETPSHVQPIQVEKSAISQKLASNLKAALPVSVAASKREAYVVQLAAFSQEQNAASLVNRLKSKGYQAKYQKQGNMFKVWVVSLGGRDDARLLQKKLAETMQMNGLIIKA